MAIPEYKICKDCFLLKPADCYSIVGGQKNKSGHICFYLSPYCKPCFTGRQRVVPTSIRQSSGFNDNKPGIWYYLRAWHWNGNNMDVGYKNGITNYTVEKRYLRDMDRIEVLQTVEFENGRDARRFETNVLAAFWQYRYLGLPIFKSGWTEMFNRDVMGLDTSLTFVLS